MTRALIPVIAIASILAFGAGVGVAEARRDEAAVQRDAADKAFKRGIDGTPNPGNKAATSWKQVEADMLEAINADPVESDRKVGTKAFVIGGTPYLPHFFRGEALIHLERWAEALDEFDKSVEQGRVQKTDYFKRLSAFYAQCQQQGYLLKDEVVKASAELDRAKNELQDALNTFDELAAKNRQGGTSDFLSRLRAGRSAIEVADQAHRAANKSRKATDFQDALRRLNDAKDVVVRVNDDFKKHLANPQPPPTPTTLPTAAETAAAMELAARRTDGEAEFKKTQARLEGLARAAKQRPAASPTGPAINTGLAEARRVLEGGRKKLSNPGSDLGVLAQSRSDFQEANRQLDVVERLMGSTVPSDRVPDVLKEGATHFFNGKYQEALDALTPEVADATGATVKPHIHVIRAAAYLALYDRGGRKDPSLQEKARAEVLACKQLQADFEPNAAAFSPRFIQFFKASKP